MKKIYCLFFIVAMAGFFGCKRAGDVLATYKGGNITRGDFYKWLEAKRFPKDSILKSRSKQKDRLEKMAIEKMTIIKAKEEGFDKNERFQLYQQMAVEPILMKRIYEKEIKEKAHFKEPAVKVRSVLLRVKNIMPQLMNPANKNQKQNYPDKEEVEKQYNDAVARAKDLIEKINNGDKFEDIARQYSDDISKKKGGEMDYIVRDMMPNEPEFTAAAFSLKEGEYTKDPIRTSRGVYIIKVEDKKEITEKNVEKIIKNKGQAARIKSSMFKRYSDEYISKLMNAPDVKKFEDKFLSKNKNDVIFSIGDKNYTVNDLDLRIDLRSTGMDAANKSKNRLTDDQRKNMAKYYFQSEVLKRDALSKGLDKDPEYIKEAEGYADGIIAREYTKNKFTEETKILYNEIKEEYDKNKESKYFKMAGNGNKRVKQVEPLANVKDRIERYLLSIKKSQKTKDWNAELLKDYNYKVDEPELEGK